MMLLERSIIVLRYDQMSLPLVLEIRSLVTPQLYNTSARAPAVEESDCVDHSASVLSPAKPHAIRLR